MLQITQDSGGPALTIHVIAERCRESIDDRHVENELAHIVRLLTEYFLGEIITDEAIVAAEMVYEFARSWATNQGKCC